MHSIQPSPLLIVGLRLDAVLSGAAALLSLAMASLLQVAVGTSMPAVLAIAVFMLTYSLMIGYASICPLLDTRLVWLVVIGNAGWAIGSVILTYSHWVTLNGLGTTVLLGQAALVALFVLLQYLGLQRSRRHMDGD